MSLQKESYLCIEFIVDSENQIRKHFNEVGGSYSLTWEKYPKTIDNSNLDEFSTLMKRKLDIDLLFKIKKSHLEITIFPYYKYLSLF